MREEVLMRFAIIFIWIFSLLAVSQASLAETSPAISQTVATSSISVDSIKTLNQAVSQSDALTESEKSDLSLQLEQAKSWVLSNSKSLEVLKNQQHDVLVAQKHELERNIALKELETEREITQNLTKSSVSNEDLYSILTHAQKELDLANSNYLKWDNTLNQFQVLSVGGSQQKLELEQSLSKLNESVTNSLNARQNDLTEQVSQLTFKARKQLLENNLKLLNFQLDNLRSLTKNAQVERDYWQKNKSLQLKTVDHLQDVLQTQKTEQAQTELEQTVQAQSDPSSPLYAIQNKIIEVQQEKAALVKQEQEIQQQINYITTTNNAIEADFSRDKQIMALEGSRDIVAQVLHKRVETLATYRIKESKTLKIKDQLNHTVLAQMLLSEKLRTANLQTPSDLLNQTLNKIKITDPVERNNIESQLIQIQAKYIESANELQTFYPDFVSKLSELNSLYNKRNQLINEYSQFLHNNLLWLPNVQVNSLLSLEALTHSLKWFFAPENLNALLADIKESYAKQTTAIFVWLMLIIALIFMRSRFKRGLKESATHITSIRTDSFIYTLKAVGFTFALSVTIPLIFIGLASLFNDLSNPSEYTQRLSNSLINAGILLFILGGLQQICRNNGLAEKHFRWQITTFKSIYKELKWALPIAVLLIMVIGLNTDSTGPSDRQLIGRIGFITLMVLLIIVLLRLWGPSSSIIRTANNQLKKHNWMQLHFIWFPVLLLIPAFLIWSTISGYYYSSLLIAERINWSIGLILITYILRELLLRNIYLSERKLHFAEKVKQQQAFMAAKTTDENAPKESSELPTIEVEELDYDKLNNQVRQTINLGFFLALAVGLWLLWGDLLLALNLINDSTLPLTKSQVIDGVVQQVPLTLGDLSQGLLLGIVTLLLAKNLPGILEYTLLKYLPISNAARYATSSLTQYIIAIIGFILIFRALGIEWSNIQWLVAALSVGLGFGLQEIVANFVSGIILLFEQPLRVGDIVTVDGVTGKVSKIRIRATTIVNWDRQELVIPNKQIITGQLINWSLSDPINRIKIDVGVAYGSDVKLAMKLMSEAADEHIEVLKEPEPSVIFENFGDNALQLSLRAFTEDLENLLGIKSQLRNAINDKLNQAGIVVAFPQRDVHLDTSEPLEVRFTRSEKPAN